MTELHALLLRAARFEVGRRRLAFPQLGGADLDDLAWQSADDALMSILRRLADFRGDSRFTPWATKFAIVEAGVKVRRHAWRGREVLLPDASWPTVADGAPTPHQFAEARELMAALREEIDRQLTTWQRLVFVAVTINHVPIDVLAERFNTTRSALYKTLHDARRRLRARAGRPRNGHDGEGAVTEHVGGGLGPEFELMIGSAGPELGCDECFDQLDTYVELELRGVRADVAMPAMRAHLVGCPACRDDHESLLAFVRADPEGAA